MYILNEQLHKKDPEHSHPSAKCSLHDKLCSIET